MTQTVYKDTGSIRKVYVDTCLSTPGQPGAGTGTGYTRQNLLVSADFEGSTPFKPFYPLNSSSCCAYSVQTSTTVAHTGAQSTLFTLYKTDPIVGAGYRSEIVPLYTENAVYNERWVGFSVYLPASFIKDPAPEVIQQVHAQNSDSPPFAICTQNGNWWIEINYDVNGTTKYNNIDLGIPYKTGVWTNWVYHVRFSKGTDGLVEVWKDGVKVYSYTGQTQYTNLTAGNYYKFGIYKWGWQYPTWFTSTSTQRQIYYDDIRIGNEKATYQDVAP
ncbi:MAG TPA: polysaccharide lyase [Chitinophagaceae bacterium]|nr:polysaccharide lyase [Chitinophagaceae bacterium]